MAKIKLPRQPSNHRTTIDWQAYFADFCFEHGGDPMIVEESQRVLFRDGWQYNLLSHKGPEYPPPKKRSELLALQVKYWTHWKKVRERELWETQVEIDRLRELASTRSLPLKQKGAIDPDTGKSIEMSMAIDEDVFITQLATFRRLRDECVEELNAIAKEREYGTTPQTIADAG